MTVNIFKDRYFNIMLSNFIAIDFEFLPAQGLIFQIGYAIVQDGKIVETCEQLIKPKCSKWEFYSMPIISEITGITYDMLQDAPPFDEIWPKLYGVINNKIIVAHNACSADLSVLSKELLRIKALDCEYRDISFDCYCTLDIARDMNHAKCGLSVLCELYNIELSSHHNACADAEAAAKLFIELQKQSSITNLTPIRFNSDYIVERYGNSDFSRTHEPYFVRRNNKEKQKRHLDLINIQEHVEQLIDSPTFFSNEVVVLTGLTHEDKEQLTTLLVEAGALVKNSVTKCTTLIIAGENAGWSKLEKAVELNIPVINRDDIRF